MKIIDAHWNPTVNTLKMQCSCGAEFWHRANKWFVRCRKCGKSENLREIREEYFAKTSQAPPQDTASERRS